MGEVYRARDTKLQRDVAIKVLPQALAHEADRLSRLEREARALAALNHHNIAQIHGLEESDGITALVMELVEGRTLADRIAEGPIPVDEVLPLAKQIAAALEAAHDQGIVHRDLKPANIKLRPDDTVKVLDFGLAKAMEPASVMSPGLSESPTIATPPMTEAGMILGTAAYMSPEQAEGKPVDKRTDIWAFGVVVYEMLTGAVPFSGESFASTVAAVLRAEPDWSRVPPVTLRMLAACLEKDPRRRLRDIGDASRLLEPAHAAAAPRRLSPLVGVLGLVLGAAITWAVARPPASAPGPVMRWSITLVEGGGGERGVALSRDGRVLAYTGRVLPRRPIWVRALDEAEGRPLPGTEGGRRPFFSPDGKWLAYFSSFGRSTLMKVPLAGGTPTRLCQDANFLGGSWGDDDRIVFIGPGGLMRVPASGGTCEVLLPADPEKGGRGYRSPQILPGGKAVLFGVASQGAEEEPGIAVLDLATGEQRMLEQRGARARYLPSGHMVYTRNTTMYAIPFNVEQLRATGPEVPAIDGVLRGSGAQGQQGLNPDYTVSDSGTLVYTAAETSHRTLTWIARGDATTVESPAPPGEYGSVSLSPDGRRAATFLTIGGSGILIIDLERGTVSRIAERGSFPIWTPDGTRIVYSQASGEVFWAPADGSANPQLLANEPVPVAGSVSPDGATLAYTVSSSADVNARSFIRLLPLPGGPPAGATAPFSSTSTHRERGGLISPDGKWIAYVSNESGRDQVYLRSYRGPGGKVPISTDGGVEPRWSRNPQELFFRNATTNQVMTVDVPAAGAEPGRPRAIVPLATSLWDVAPDGKRFLIVKDPDPDADSGTVRVVVNWFEELRQKTSAR
jgi:serine/threonine-protein kinase